jgi:hypothetical protein
VVRQRTTTWPFSLVADIEASIVHNDPKADVTVPPLPKLASTLPLLR